MSMRLATPADAAALAAIYAPYVRDTVISFEETAPDASAFAQRIEAVLARYPYLVFEQEGIVLGYAYASPHAERAAYRWAVDVAVYVAPEAHRRGIGRALYGELLPILERQGFHAAFAGVTLPNPASVALHEAMGFEPAGLFREVGFKQGAWRDVGWWRRPLSSDVPVGEPVPFPALREI